MGETWVDTGKGRRRKRKGIGIQRNGARELPSKCSAVVAPNAVTVSRVILDHALGAFQQTERLEAIKLIRREIQEICTA